MRKDDEPLHFASLTEAMLCRNGHSYEEATEWHESHPDV